LAVPAGSARVDAFVSEARVSGRSTAILSIEPSGQAGTDDPLIPWNPLSFASARVAIIEAETVLGGSLDELVMFADPPEDQTGIVELTPKALESAALSWAAGWAELIREAAKRFTERGGGTILLVVVHAERGPLGAMAAGALIGLAEGMLSVGCGPVKFIAVRDESGQPDMLARLVVRTLDEPPRDQGKVQRFGGRSNLFGRN
jgi:hypothetical protein